jgi:hypothetical protein
MERDTRETVEEEFGYCVFDTLVEDYFAGKVSLDGLKTAYEQRTGEKVVDINTTTDYLL